MEHIWSQVEAIRDGCETLRDDRIPIDIFTYLEIDLGLHPIPFSGLASKYQVEAALRADFSGIYLDEEQYTRMEEGWKLNRLRFTVAHELGHYHLHRKIPQPENFASLVDFARWSEGYGGNKYSIEQEANEFAGRLLVPISRLRAFYDKFEEGVSGQIPNFTDLPDLRERFAESAGEKFGVNSQVIGMRLDREGLWPVG